MPNKIYSYAFPGNIEKEILEIGNEQIPYMRTLEFSQLYLRCSKTMSDLAYCSGGKTIIYTMSGTAVLENSILSYGRIFNNLGTINGGSFGARWKSICEYHDLECHEFLVGFGKDIEVDNLRGFLLKNSIDCLFMQHHETSSGQLYDVKKIGQLCKELNVFFVVDIISSLFSDYVNMDEQSIDVALCSSQKGLNLPPGLSFMILSKNALRLDQRKSNFYYDIGDNLRNLERGQTPFSPATQIFLQLDKKLEIISTKGTSEYISNVRKMSMYFKQLCKTNGWQLASDNPSHSMTAFYVEKNGDRIVECLLRKGIYIMPSCEQNLLRVTHTGLQNERDLDKLVALIKSIQEETNEE